MPFLVLLLKDYFRKSHADRAAHLKTDKGSISASEFVFFGQFDREGLLNRVSLLLEETQRSGMSLATGGNRPIAKYTAILCDKPPKIRLRFVTGRMSLGRSHLGAIEKS
jgi:hypothetical protein